MMIITYILWENNCYNKRRRKTYTTYVIEYIHIILKEEGIIL